MIGASSCPVGAAEGRAKGKAPRRKGETSAPSRGAVPPASGAQPFLVLKETTQSKSPRKAPPEKRQGPLQIWAKSSEEVESLLQKFPTGTVVSWQSKGGRVDESQDASGRRFIRKTDADGEVKVQGRFGRSSSYELRQKFCIEANTAGFIERFGDASVGFLTLTFPENLTDFEEAQRRFNSFWTNCGRELFGDYLRVIEVQKRGAVHYHLLVSLPVDVKGAFDWDAFTQAQDFRRNGDMPAFRALTREYVRKLKEGGAEWLVNTWATLREVLPRYGFGRSELLPIRSNFEGMSKYIGKYISKSQVNRPPEMKGVRLFSSSVKGWVKPCTMSFQFVSRGSALFRARVARLAAHLSVTEEQGLSSRLGPKWAYRLKYWLCPDSESECPRDLPLEAGGWDSDQRDAWEDSRFSELLALPPRAIVSLALAHDRFGDGKRGAEWSWDERMHHKRLERVPPPPLPSPPPVSAAPLRAAAVGYGRFDL